MKALKIIGIGVIVLVAGGAAFVVTSSEPVVGFPGGRLAGTEQPSPEDWGSAASMSVVQIETRPDEPYSVNIWGVGIGPDFYVSTSAEGTGWSNNVDANRNVRLRVGETIYPLTAVTVTDSAERERVLTAYISKYEADPTVMATQAGLIYRLDER